MLTNTLNDYPTNITITNRLLPYSLNSGTLTMQNSLFNYKYSLSGIVNNDITYTKQIDDGKKNIFNFK